MVRGTSANISITGVTEVKDEFNTTENIINAYKVITWLENPEKWILAESVDMIEAALAIIEARPATGHATAEAKCHLMLFAVEPGGAGREKAQQLLPNATPKHIALEDNGELKVDNIGAVLTNFGVQAGQTLVYNIDCDNAVELREFGRDPKVTSNVEVSIAGKTVNIDGF